MKKPRYYFKYSDSEICYTKEYFMDLINEGQEVEVFQAIPDKIDGVFWCKEHLFCGDDSRDTCGRQCKDYKPRNGKSGCCSHYTTTLYVHGDKVIIKK